MQKVERAGGFAPKVRSAPKVEILLIKSDLRIISPFLRESTSGVRYSEEG